MTVGERIRKARYKAGLTQEKLGNLSGIAGPTIRRYELGLLNPKAETLQKIAAALDVTPAYLMGWEEPVKKGDYPFRLEDKLRQLGYSVGFYEDDAMMWINYPDGTLEVTVEELRKLENSTLSYLQFNLEELKKQRINDFRFNKK